jgi:hypothetical protein
MAALRKGDLEYILLKICKTFVSDLMPSSA